ncbi:hypothetical protein GC170_18850 [bacterium]|nr:hypothetical protein [bacterium]
MEKKPHSGLGIASLILSTSFGIQMIVSSLLIFLVAHSAPCSFAQDSPESIGFFVYLFMCGSIVFIALSLGVAGLFQSDRRKLFPVFGTLFSLLIFASFMAFFAIVSMSDYEFDDLSPNHIAPFEYFDLGPSYNDRVKVAPT